MHPKDVQDSCLARGR